MFPYLIPNQTGTLSKTEYLSLSELIRSGFWGFGVADRENRELPISADFVGEQVRIPKSQILVLEKDDAGKFSFQLEERPE